MAIRAMNLSGLRWTSVLILSAAAHSSWAANYYVATTGSNSNPGTSISAPFKTIQYAMERVQPGDTVFVRGGTYREQVEARKGGSANKPVNVVAYGSEIPVIKGSDVVTGWVSDGGGVWKKTAWPHNSQQVFVDWHLGPRKSLQQIGMPAGHFGPWEYPKPVGSGRSSMTPGSFYYNASAQTLYVWLADGSNPNQHVMEVSVRRRLFMMHQPYMHIKGFRFRHTSMSAFAQQGAAIEMSSNSVVENCDIQYVDSAGISMGYLKDNAHVYNCNISNNGSLGISADGSRKFWVKNVTLSYNNSRNFNQYWHAGGLKGTTGTHGIVEDSEMAYNNGPGIWFDHANSGSQIVVRNNYVHDNTAGEAGIFLEVSNNGLVYNNVVARNRVRGIYVSAGSNSQIYNNTVHGTIERAGIEVAGMPRGSATLKNNVLYNNIISHGTSKYDLFFQPANGTTIAGNRSDYNNFYRPTRVISLSSGSTYPDLAAWRIATGQDMNSMSVNPMFVSPGSSATGYSLNASSPVINKGIKLAGNVPDDYLKVYRPVGAAFDIGAFEFSPPAAIAATAIADTIDPVVTINSTVATTTTSLTISASATDNVGVTTMALYVDGALKVSSTSGQITHVWPNPQPGAHELKIIATDEARNEGSATATLTIR